MDRFRLMLIASLGSLATYAELHKKEWDKEIKENKGYLDKELKYSLTRGYNLSLGMAEKIDDEYSEVEVKKSIDKTLRKISDNLFYKSPEKGEFYFEYKDEEKVHPQTLLQSFTLMCATHLFIKEKLMPTIKKYNLEKEFATLTKYLNKYSNFYENEMIITGGHWGE